MASLAAAEQDFVPVFQRPTMLIIKSRVDILDQRLAQNGEWNLGEKLELKKILGEIKELTEKFNQESLPALADLEAQYEAQTREYRMLYEATALIMKKEAKGKTWDKVITISKKSK